MNWLDNFIIKNHDIVQFFGGFWVATLFSVSIVLVVAGIIFGNHRRVLPSQKGKTEFARYYSDKRHLVEKASDAEQRDRSSVVRIMNTAKKQKQNKNVSFIDNKFPDSQNVVDFYFEFNEKYYLPES